MNVVIVEDEEFAARRLESLISEIDPAIKVVAKLESVAGSVEWFAKNQTPDLIFMDIHLEDSLSFAIFEVVSINCPIVFTTATDESSTHIFRQNGLDYLLKPIAKEELAKIISKYKNLSQNDVININASLFNNVINKSES